MGRFKRILLDIARSNKIKSERRTYPLEITINGCRLEEIVIDSHYEEKHSNSINDELILNLVKMLDGGFFTPNSTSGEFQYFVADDLKYQGKFYKLIWLLQNNEKFIGVVNAHRR